MRKLASIQRIYQIDPINGADNIELVHVLGWQCVANKGQFRVGDRCVYFEIDSFLPTREEFEFLRSSSYKKSDIMGEGFKIKTMKFRGQISQGLVLPVSAFSELPKILGRDYIDSSDYGIGMDVSDALGVKKWEIEERATTGGTIIGQLPMDVPHTDEPRIQAEPELLNEFAGLKYYISTKMDGSSHSVSLDENGFHVTGHNYEYKDDDSSSFYRLVKERDIQTKMEKYCKNSEIQLLTIQGEFCAPGIQKNRLKLQKPEWYVFTIRIDGERVGLDRMLEICKELDLISVPIEEVDDDLPSKYPTIDDLLARADGEYPNGGKKEGIVIRPVEPIYSPTIQTSLSMKVVNNKYLLKNND